MLGFNHMELLTIFKSTLHFPHSHAFIKVVPLPRMLSHAFWFFPFQNPNILFSCNTNPFLKLPIRSVLKIHHQPPFNFWIWCSLWCLSPCITFNHYTFRDPPLPNTCCYLRARTILSLYSLKCWDHFLLHRRLSIKLSWINEWVHEQMDLSIPFVVAIISTRCWGANLDHY